MKYKIDKLLELFNLLIKDLKSEPRSERFKNFCKNKDLIGKVYDNQLKDILIKELELSVFNELDDFLKDLERKSTFTDSTTKNDYEDTINKLENYRNIISEIKLVKKEYKTIFYSWQSDLEPKFYRTFIQNSVESVIKKINNNFNLDIHLDESTRYTPGSPDITNTILSKIEKSNIFICDISSIVKIGDKEIPNPNVLFELGYAMHCLGDSNIIMIFNEFSGNIKDLPFDLKQKRLFTYKLDSSSCKPNIKNELENKLEYAIKLILGKN